MDPLDGTKEFIKRNGQFTVNIGLCKGCVRAIGREGVWACGSTTGQARGYITLTDFPSVTYEHDTPTHHLSRNSPIFGVVHVPAMEPAKTYYGVKGQVHTHAHSGRQIAYIHTHAHSAT